MPLRMLNLRDGRGFTIRTSVRKNTRPGRVGQETKPRIACKSARRGSGVPPDSQGHSVRFLPEFIVFVDVKGWGAIRQGGRQDFP